MVPVDPGRPHHHPSRAGFRRYWHWKSRRRGGPPQVQSELRALIRQMSVENPLWGAPRIHGELLKLGFEVSQSSVAKYMVRRRGPPSQGWRAFLRNHAPDIAAMDLFVVPTIGFELLYAFVIVRLDRRDLIWIDVTTSDGGMDRAPNNRGVSLEGGSALPHPRSGPHLWRHRHTSIARHGHKGQADCARFTLAECFRRTVDSQSAANAWTTLLSLVRRICAGSCDAMPIITTKSEPIGPEQGCAALSRRSASWNHQITRNPRRTSSPIRPDLVFATHKIKKIPAK